MKKLKLKKSPPGDTKTKTYTDKSEYNKNLEAYNDSLKLYNSYIDLKTKLKNEDYVKVPFINNMLLSEDEVIKEALRDKSEDDSLTEYFGKFIGKRPYLKASKEGNLFKALDFYPGDINEKLGYQYFSDKIKPTSKETYRKHRFVGDARLVYNYENVKPKVIPSFTEKTPTSTETVKSTNPIILKRKIENIPFIPIKKSILNNENNLNITKVPDAKVEVLGDERFIPFSGQSYGNPNIPLGYWEKGKGNKEIQNKKEGGNIMKKLKIQRKKYADGTPAVGVVGDEDMSASSLRGDALSAWNAAQTQAEKDKILADANAKKTAKNNATMAAVGNTLNAGSKALGKGDQHTSDVEQGVNVVQDTVASVVPVAGLFHGISEMGQSIGAKIDPKNADKQKYFFEPHRLITDGLIGGEFAGTADWQIAEKKKKQEEGIATALRAQSDVNYVPRMKEGGEVTFKGDKEKTVLMLPDGTKSTYAEYQKKSGYNDSVIINNFKLENKPPAQMAVGKMEQENRPIVNEEKYTFKVRATDKEGNPISEWHTPGEKPQQVLKYKSTLTPMFKTITKAEGGEVSGAGGPKDDKVKMTLQERSFVVPAENADKAEALREKYLGKTTKKMKSGGNVPVKLSDGEHVFTPEERDVLESNGVDLTALAPNAKEDDFNLKHGGSVQKGYADGTTKDGVTPTSSSSLEQQLLDKIAAMRTNKTITEEDAAIAEAEASNPARQLALSEALQIPMAEAAATEDEIAAQKDTEKKNKLLKVSDALGGATGALALAQIGLGLGQTLSGKRPKFKVDSEFLGRIGDALKSEKSGLPEATKTAALNKLGLGRKALTNYATSISGGNTGTAFAAAKEAAGQEAAGIVELASRDAMMMLQKKNRTDSLVSHLQGLKRQAFEDDLNAFSQNQQAGAQLTQAGISNFVGNKQYKDAQDRMDARLAKYGTTGLTTTT